MQASKAASGAKTNEVMVAAPGAGKQIVVYSVFISTDTAQAIMLESGNSDLRWRQYCAANGGSVSASPVVGGQGHLFTCADNAALTWTVPGGNSFVSAQYEVVKTFDETS